MSDLSAAHQWTNGGEEVLILRCCDSEGKSYGGFQWPTDLGAEVEALDWNPQPVCGAGLHGWAWGLSMQDGKDAIWDGIWIVFGAKPSNVVSLGGKCKARCGVIRFAGKWNDATNFVLSGQIALIVESASGAASATGWSGAASATGASGAASATGASGAASATGERGAASATGARGAASATGWRGAASATGWRGAASATGESGAASATGESGAASATGESGAASATGARGAASATGESGAASATGWSGAASATGASGAASATGWSGAASATGESGAASATGESGAASATGERGAAVCTGLNGKAKAGKHGCIALAWWNTADNRTEMLVAKVGSPKGLKPDTWYQVNASGRFVEAK